MLRNVLLAALCVTILVAAVVVRPSSSPSTSSVSSPTHYSVKKHTSTKWPKCDFDGDPTNDVPGTCPAYKPRRAN